MRLIYAVWLFWYSSRATKSHLRWQTDCFDALDRRSGDDGADCDVNEGDKAPRPSPSAGGGADCDDHGDDAPSHPVGDGGGTSNRGGRRSSGAECNDTSSDLGRGGGGGAGAV